ncbi:hypothetical protein FRACYDRAFT_249628 [Fragilariopsis cylindrus CCMP1102]|uniref:RNI-like protein n=1 Tax=Fragilariopsis cylindrus CCMP1102 TaxID=635003 RepID=A0A1E7ES99_9STRA|nr:hypothetical protein FRACYDRAFT_249628 [Fragilariopsis cylindrus CCMP1102]|eukprot:OEU08726.1 hypothetical protein FRACYDRAFT_249628 [Fragilariopsis cylindrus CCMP1102]
MNEVEAEAEAEADAEQCRIVAKCMHHVPDNIVMNIKEGYNLMNMLYKVGILSDYLADLDTDDGINIYGENVEFKDYFDFNDEENIRIDPKTGRITFLCLFRRNYDLFGIPNNVPSSIDQFQSLESIDLKNCQLLTMELGNLPVLKTINFNFCTSNMFANTPEGLQLSSTKKVTIDSSSITKFNSNLSSFLKIFSNTLEELCFGNMTRGDSDEILHVLQNDNLCFRHSLTTIQMRYCKLNEDDLKRLLFEIRERFPNLHTLGINCNNIESLCGIGDRIKQVPFIPNNKLLRLNLNRNPIFKQICVPLNATKDPKEIAALVTLLDKFDGISNLGAYSCQKYEPKIEYALRINIAGRKELIRGKSSRIINRALWPLILVRAYKNSSEIYIYDRYSSDTVTTSKEVESKKCASGLFHLVHHFYAPVMIEDRGGGGGSSTTTNITNDNSIEGSNKQQQQQHA